MGFFWFLFIFYFRRRTCWFTATACTILSTSKTIRMSKTNWDDRRAVVAATAQTSQVLTPLSRRPTTPASSSVAWMFRATLEGKCDSVIKRYFLSIFLSFYAFSHKKKQKQKRDNLISIRQHYWLAFYEKYFPLLIISDVWISVFVWI